MASITTANFRATATLARLRAFFYEKASQGHPPGGFRISSNAVDVSLLFALVLDNIVSGAWNGPSSGCHLAGALFVLEPNIAVTGTGRPLFVESRFRWRQILE